MASFTSFPTNVPIKLRIKQTSGSSSEKCYIDDLTVQYDSTWEPEPEEPEYLLGDVNGDDSVDIDDVTMLINSVLNGGGYYPAGDMNSDESIDIDDVTALINVILGVG